MQIRIRESVIPCLDTTWTHIRTRTPTLNCIRIGIRTPIATPNSDLDLIFNLYLDPDNFSLP